MEGTITMHTRRLTHLEIDECGVDMLSETQSVFEILFGWMSWKPVGTALHSLFLRLKS